jgi:predicted RNA-binding protein with PIN domain
VGDPERLAGLPPRARASLVELAGQVLADLEEASTPPALARVRLFAPARRAKAGAGPLAATLERDAGFRALVASAWRARHPETAAVLPAPPDLADDVPVDVAPGLAPGLRDGPGDGPGAVAAAPAGSPGPDPAEVIQGLFLIRPQGWQDAVARLASELGRQDDERARRQGEESAAVRLRACERELDRLRADAAAARAAAAQATEELGSARREIRRLRAEADRARAAAREAGRAAEDDRRRAQEEVGGAQAELARERDRATAARERAEQAQRAVREGRSLDQARLRLLLDTVVDAASGLRRELALPPVEVRPADFVAAEADAPGGRGQDGAAAGVATRGQAPDDPALLAELLALPQAHLVVDGYNVSKGGFGTLPLIEQRRRLVEALGALAARTRAEVTCVFDGAEVEARSALRLRGVRVLFSEPGTTADELIRRLVRAEPSGRPVVVVSSDNEVASGVRAAGARPVPAAALLRLVGRG